MVPFGVLYTPQISLIQILFWQMPAVGGQLEMSPLQHSAQIPSQQICDPGHRLSTSVLFCLFRGTHWPPRHVLIRQGPTLSQPAVCNGSSVSGLLLTTHVPLLHVTNWQGADVPHVLTKSSQQDAQAPSQQILPSPQSCVLFGLACGKQVLLLQDLVLHGPGSGQVLASPPQHARQTPLQQT